MSRLRRDDREGARTSVFDPEGGRLYLAVPRAGATGQENPEVWVYRPSVSSRQGRDRRGERMKWVTREDAKVDRIACPWLIRRFVDPDAEFLYVPAAR